MLEFFRKYQRYFFFFITGVIIITFSLFGSYKTFSRSGQAPEDPVVGHAVDGSKLHYFAIKQLSNLLASEKGEKSVIEKEFIRSGLGIRLASDYFSSFLPEWQTRLDRAKRYRFFSYPKCDSISAEKVWNMMSPELIKALTVIRTIETPNTEFLEKWFQIYTIQTRMTSDMMKNFLFYQIQEKKLPIDQQLYYEDFSLFGFHTIPDWFGPAFVDAISQVILNGAIIAEQNGFSATPREALDDLSERFQSKNLNADSFGKESIEIWRRVLTYLRYLHSMSQSVVVDDLSYKEIDRYTNESAILDVYRLPSELQLQNIDDFVAYEWYAENALEPNSLLPTAPLSVDTVLQRAPELVASSYRMNVASLNIEDLRQRVSLKELWDWQNDISHWQEIQNQFSDLSSINAKTPFRALETLASDRREEVDDWCRDRILFSQPKYLEDSWKKSEAKARDVLIFASNEIDGFPAKNVLAFQDILEKAAHHDEQALSQLQDMQIDKTIYRLTDIEKVSDQTVISFARAKKLKRLSVKTFLENEYARIREENPEEFLNENQEWKELSKVKETVVRKRFAPTLMALDSLMEDAKGKRPIQEYVRYRFVPYMKKMKESLTQNVTALPYLTLWELEKSEKNIKRGNDDWMTKTAFSLNVMEWSDVNVMQNGDVAFFCLKERKPSTESVYKKVIQGKEKISTELKQKICVQLLDEIKQKQVMTIPLVIEKETDDDS